MWQEVLYVAECGSNHLGSLEIALELIKFAHEAGAGAVKFQLFEAEKLDSRSSVIQQLKPYELRKEWIPALSIRARAYGMKFIVTPFDLECIACLDGYVDMVKISAYDITYLNLIKEACLLEVPVVISTAMASGEEILAAVDIIPDNLPRILLHGVASYPALYIYYAIAKLYELSKIVTTFGISDHTLGTPALEMAVQFPIVMAEKHFRLFTTPKKAPDYEVSLPPPLFAEYIKIGKGRRNMVNNRVDTPVLQCEEPLYNTARRYNHKPLRG